MDKWLESVYRHQDKFGTAPTIIGLSPEMKVMVGELCAEGVERDVPVTDEDLVKKLGLEFPPEGAVI